MQRLLSFVLVAGLLGTGSVAARAEVTALERSVAPVDAQVYFISPSNGEVVENPVTVRFGLRAMGVAPAGVNQAGTGHHHLLIDLDQLPAMGASLPANENIRHFGAGQTETTLELTPGVHSLQLLMGNYLHVPHQAPVISEKISITVK